MNKLLTLVGVIVLLGCGVSQKIPSTPSISLDLKKQELRINKRKINGDSRLFDITKALGRYDRTQEVGGFYAYFYDQYGILVLENKETRTIEEVDLQYVLQRGKKGTENTFTGHLALGKKPFSAFRSPLDLELQFPNITFQLLFDVLLKAELERMNIAIIYTSEYDPELITVNFAKTEES